MLKDPVWLAAAKKYLGVAEIKGPQHNPHILNWWNDIGTRFADDETPWCGAFVGGVLAEVGFRPVLAPSMARSWRNCGVDLGAPAVGAIVVFWRGQYSGTSGHVGFIVGKDQKGNLMVLGGNQADKVSIAPFSRDRVLDYRWPGIMPYAERFNLPIINSDGRVSQNEA